MLTHFFNLYYAEAFRLMFTFLTSFAIMLIFGKKFIIAMRSRQNGGQPIREEGPQSHLLTKKGTPTMGGILILFAIIVSTLLFMNPWNVVVWICLVMLVIFGITGFIDDYVKVKKRTSNAMTAKMKLVIQFVAALGAVWLITSLIGDRTRYAVYFPYIDFLKNAKWLYIPFAVLVITGTSNAVNLTDGLDGLASGLCIVAFAAFGILCAFSNIPGAQDISIVCVAVSGACLGFLWFNCSPAQIFMGDTGSLALGALLGTIAVAIKQEFLLAVIGIIFVVETLSVMIQVFWYKRTKKRIFRMAPIHHHFEQVGLKETTIVTRFWVISIIAAVIGLSALLFVR